MASQFDAVARISVDLRGFRQASQQVLKSGGEMERVFRDLHSMMERVDVVEKKLASDISRTMRVYSQVASAAKSYATAIQSLAKDSNATAVGTQKMAAAFEHLRSALGAVQGMSAREHARVARTLDLYERMARALRTLAQAQQAMASVTQKAQQLDQQAAASKQRAADAAERLAIAQQRLALSQRQSNAAMQASADGLTRFSNSTFALRSSLGELEQGYRRLTQILFTVPTAMAGAAISQEKAFAQVARVVGEAEAATVGLKESFQDIAQSAPISFEEVSKIGQLGAQIGISENHLAGFTDTVTKFTLTTGVAAEESTLLLGRIAEMQNVPVSQMENLGSAILALGTASAATDQEILRVNESIATVGNLFGLSTEAVSGLSAAMATLKVRPELARGALTRVFGQLRDAAEGGGVQLKQLSEVMGMTSDETSKLMKQNPDEFFLAFVKGLQGVEQSGGSIRTALGGIGIEATRDIDAISRLGNNYDLLSSSFTRAYDEFAKGSELQRQSQGIYDTTAARVQNLADSFKNFLASAGGPLAAGIGKLAEGLAWVVEKITDIGPIIGVFGSLATAVTFGVAAWAGYQVVLAKVMQSIIAMRELQRNLGVTTLGVGTAIDVWKGKLGGTVATTVAATNATRMLQASTTSLAASLSASAASSTAISAANRNIAVSSAQAGAASQLMVGQMTLARGATVGLNTAAAATVPAMTSMSAAMQRAVAAGAAMGSGLQMQGIKAAQATVGMNALTAATTRASIASRAASLAFGPWGIAITAVTLGLTVLTTDLFNFSSAADEVYSSSIQAAGGTDALANAIKADTAAAAKGAESYRKVAVSKRDVSAADRESALSTRAAAQARLNEIRLVAGSTAQLKRQAEGHSSGARAARQYLGEIRQQNKVVRESSAVLDKNTASIGKQTRKWMTETAEAAAGKSGLSKSAGAMEKLAETGINVGDILTEGLQKPEKASTRLQAAINSLNQDATLLTDQRGMSPELSRSLEKTKTDAQSAQNFLKALKSAVGEQGNEAAKSARVQQLLGKALDSAGKDAAAMGGKVKLTQDNLEDMDISAEDAQRSIDNLAGKFEQFGTPLTAFKDAAESAFGSAEGSIKKLSLSAKSGLDAYLKELEKIATAQRNWATNLVKISATLGPDIAKQFQELGPEAAPAVEELANLGVDELAKVKPRLEAIGTDATSGLAASIIKGSGKIKNASASTASVISNLFGKEAGKAKTSGQFDSVVSDYQRVVATLNKSKAKIDIDVDQAKAFKSLQDIRDYINLINNAKIKPDVAIDMIKAKGDIEKLRAAVMAAKKDGSLDVKAKATLDSVLYTSALQKLQGQVAAAKREHKVDAEGKAKLDPKGYQEELNRLKNSVAAQVLKGVLDPKGKAKLSPEEYKTALSLLKSLKIGAEKGGGLDPKGTAKLDTTKFKDDLWGLRGLTNETRKGIEKQLQNIKPSVATQGYQNQLHGLVQAADRTGGSIQAALSRTATVNVVYRAANRPPKTAQAADGGWIRGPGGPRGDKIHTMLSDTEFVVNAKSAKRHAALLESINSRRGARNPVQRAQPQGVSYARARNARDNRPVRSTPRGLGTDGKLRRDYGRSDVKQAPIISVNNTYPQAEPTSTTINRSLVYAAALNGTLR